VQKGHKSNLVIVYSESWLRNCCIWLLIYTCRNNSIAVTFDT